jgi:DNA polymerase-3 subunit epsilon
MEKEKIIFVYIDIETDALRANKLLQIAAVTEDNRQFSLHINPNADLPLNCTNITGLYFYRNNLYKNGRLLPSVTVRRALYAFKDWIIRLNHKVHLVGHNIFAFDIKVLIKHYMRLKIQLPSNIVNIHDTLPVFRKNIKETEIEDHKLGTLATFLKIELKHPHDALYDSIALKDICETFIKGKEIELYDLLKTYEKPLQFFIKQQEELKIKNGYL